MQLHRQLTRPTVSGQGKSLRVRPFTASKQHVRPALKLKATDPAAEAPVAEDGYEQEQVAVALDSETMAAVRVAEEMMATYSVEALLESEVASVEGSALAAGAESLLSEAMEAARGAMASEIQAAAALASSGADVAELEIQDWQSGAGFRKYDEEEMAPSPEQQQAVVPFKLTRQELANLVPQDWANTNVDWFTSRKEEKIPLPEYKLSFLWQEKNIAVAVDQVYSRGQTSPLTEFFFWPRKDAWEELKAALEARPWVSERDKVILLNRLTEVINFWQDEQAKHTVEEARAAFPDVAFS